MMRSVIAVAALVASSVTVAEYNDPWEMLTFNCVDRDDGTTSPYSFWRFSGESDKYTEFFTHKSSAWESNANTLAAYLYRAEEREELKAVYKLDRSTGQMKTETFFPWGVSENYADCELRPDNKF